MADDQARSLYSELVQVRLWPAWKCVVRVEGPPSYPGAPSPRSDPSPRCAFGPLGYTLPQGAVPSHPGTTQFSELPLPLLSPWPAPSQSIPDGVDVDVDSVKAHARAYSQDYTSHHGRANIVKSAHDTSSHAARRRREIVTSARQEAEAGAGVGGGAGGGFVADDMRATLAASASNRALTMIGEHESEVGSSRV